MSYFVPFRFLILHSTFIQQKVSPECFMVSYHVRIEVTEDLHQSLSGWRQKIDGRWQWLVEQCVIINNLLGKLYWLWMSGIRPYSMFLSYWPRYLTSSYVALRIHKRNAEPPGACAKWTTICTFSLKIIQCFVNKRRNDLWESLCFVDALWPMSLGAERSGGRFGEGEGQEVAMSTLHLKSGHPLATTLTSTFSVLFL